MRFEPLLRVTLLACFALAPRSEAQCFDWSTDFAPPGASGGARAQATFDHGSGPKLYVAGDAPGPGLDAIRAWDGAAWTAVPSTLGAASSSFARVSALLEFDDGSGPTLIAAGRFSSIDGVAATNIARWDGSTWSPIGPGLFGDVRTLAVFDSGSGPELHAGGAFPVPSTCVVRWNGSAWTPVGAAMGNTLGPTSVDTLLVYDNGSGPGLIAGGWFDSVDGLLVRNVARWNGVAWAPFGNGNVLSTFDLCVYDDGSGPALYAGGLMDFTNSGFIAKLDSQGTWAVQGGAIDGFVASLEVFDDGSGSKLYVGGAIRSIAGTSVGNYGVARWDGAAWSKPTNGSGLLCKDCGGPAPFVYSMALYDDGSGPGLYVGGDFEFADLERAGNIARFDAGGWSALGAGETPTGRTRALAVFDDGAGAALYAGGNFLGAGGVYSPLVARFDGTTWSAVGGGGAANGEVRALVSYDDGTGPVLVAGGTFTTIDGVAASRIARWNGATWAELGGGVLAANGETLVSDLAVFDHGAGPQLYAGGWFTNAGGTAVSNIARWNGTTWLPLGAGLLGSPSAFAVYDSGNGPALFVGLESAIVNGAPNIFGVARWNGTNWSGVGGGLWNASGARDLAVYDSGSGPQLHAIGNFKKAGQLDVRGLARWNGTAWSSVGDLTPTAPLASVGSTLGVFNEGGSSVLFAAGFSESASLSSGGVFRGVARWDGSAWSGVNGGLSGQALEFALSGSAILVDAATSFGGKFYFAGAFTQAGDTASAYLARWAPACNCPPVSYCTAGVTTNGCQAQMAASGTPSASASSGFTLQALQVEGAKAGLIFYGVNGRHASPWGSGTSFLCLRAPTQRMSFQQTGGTAGQCDGLLTTDWNAWRATHPATLGAPFAAGQVVQAQGWFRDPPAPKATSLSNAIEFYVCP